MNLSAVLAFNYGWDTLSTTSGQFQESHRPEASSHEVESIGSVGNVGILGSYGSPELAENCGRNYYECTIVHIRWLIWDACWWLCTPGVEKLGSEIKARERRRYEGEKETRR